jgi:hypothetical protein
MWGRTVPRSPPRRVAADLLHLAASFPTVPISRRMQLGPLADARRQCPDRPPWVALFAKAYDLVGAQEPALRRAYLKLPWPHIREYPGGVAMLAVERVYGGEPALFFARIKTPAQQTLPWLAARIRNFRDTPVEQVADFRMLMTLGRIPWPLRRLLLWCLVNVSRSRASRFGTFGITNVGALGARLIHPQAAVTTLLTYGPIGEDGRVEVTIVFDHRVVDGAVMARVLQRLEDTLNGAVRDELRAGYQA